MEIVAAHELAHRFVAAVAANAPSWLHEGFAKYAESLTLLDDRAVFDMAELHGGYVFFHDFVPLRTVLAASRADFHGGDRVAHYMTAWMMIRHILVRPGGDGRRRFRALLDRVSADPEAAAHASAIETVFEVSLAQVERELAQIHHAILTGIDDQNVRRHEGVGCVGQRRVGDEEGNVATVFFVASDKFEHERLNDVEAELH